MKKFMLGRKNIGELEDGVFYKEVLLSKHLFRVLDAWGIDSQTLSSLPNKTKIEIHEQEENKVYQSTKEEYIEYGQYYHFKEPRADHRTQLFLPRKWFRVDEPKKLEGEALDKHNYLVSQGIV